MTLAMTTHQELEHLEAVAVVLGDLMCAAMDSPIADEATFWKWEQELEGFVSRSKEQKLRFILKKYSRDRPNTYEGSYAPLFEHYVKAINEMRDELYRLKAINRSYVTEPEGDGSIFIGEYEIRGVDIYIKDLETKEDVMLKLSPQNKSLLNAFLKMSTEHILTVPEIAKITESDPLDTKLIAGQIDKLNQRLFHYCKKRMIQNMGRSEKPLRYKLYLANELRWLST